MSGAGFRLSRSAPGTLAVDGVLTFATAAAALREITAAMQAETLQRLDLAGLERSDSAGLACVLAVQAEAARQGRSLAVDHMPVGMSALAKVCEVDTLTG
jgi:phospholipid transport system transporter-binding protein